MNIFSILTEQTCGEPCWHAHQPVCHCSCGGKNHGILNTPGGQRPCRMAKMNGYPYKLAAVGGYDDLYPRACEINKQAGYKSINEPRLIVDGAEMDKEHSTQEYAALKRAAGSNVWWSQYHYCWSTRDEGAPARIKYVTQAQLNGWVEVQAYQGSTSGGHALLWIREVMPDRPKVLMVDKQTGLPLEDQNPSKCW